MASSSSAAKVWRSARVRFCIRSNGDSNTRNTWQGKTGIVLNPNGAGIFTRPSLRLLYGLQYSTAQDAFASGYVTSASQFNQFVGPEQHWHSVVGVEAEAWF